MEKEPAFKVVERRSSQRTDEDRALDVKREEDKRQAETARKRLEVAQEREARRRGQLSIGKSPFAIDTSKAGNYWKEIAYTVILTNVNGMTLAVGRCLGDCSDGRMAYADYVFGPKWEEGFDWTKEARSRLETYLNCTCSSQGPCLEHQGNPWMEEGMSRVQKQSQQAMPAILEKYYRAEMAKKGKGIILPR